jgi:hypothetical protein
VKRTWLASTPLAIGDKKIIFIQKHFSEFWNMNTNIESVLFDLVVGTTLGTIVPNDDCPSQIVSGAGQRTKLCQNAF